MIKKQTVYVPTNNDKDLAVCYFSSFEEWTHKETVKETEGYFFTPEELKQLLEEYTNRIVENATVTPIDHEEISEGSWRPVWGVDDESITNQLPLMLKELGYE
jgi:hypothetical protein